MSNKPTYYLLGYGDYNCSLQPFSQDYVRAFHTTIDEYNTYHTTHVTCVHFIPKLHDPKVLNRFRTTNFRVTLFIIRFDKGLKRNLMSNKPAYNLLGSGNYNCSLQPFNPHMLWCVLILYMSDQTLQSSKVVSERQDC